MVRGGAREARRMSSCDTALFIWSTDAAASRWPVTDDAEAEMRAAMRGAIPRKIKQRATKANKAAHLAKRRGKRRANAKSKGQNHA